MTSVASSSISLAIEPVQQQQQPFKLQVSSDCADEVKPIAIKYGAKLLTMDEAKALLAIGDTHGLYFIVGSKPDPATYNLCKENGFLAVYKDWLHKFPKNNKLLPPNPFPFLILPGRKRLPKKRQTQQTQHNAQQQPARSPPRNQTSSTRDENRTRSPITRGSSSKKRTNVVLGSSSPYTDRPHKKSLGRQILRSPKQTATVMTVPSSNVSHSSTHSLSPPPLGQNSRQRKKQALAASSTNTTATMAAASSMFASSTGSSATVTTAPNVRAVTVATNTTSDADTSASSADTTASNTTLAARVVSAPAVPFVPSNDRGSGFTDNPSSVGVAANRSSGVTNGQSSGVTSDRSSGVLNGQSSKGISKTGSGAKANASAAESAAVLRAALEAKKESNNIVVSSNDGVGRWTKGDDNILSKTKRLIAAGKEVKAKRLLYLLERSEAECDARWDVLARNKGKRH